MPVTQGKDTMYGGSPRTPANSPNDAVISGNGSFTINNWNGSQPVGGTIQLFIRQWNGSNGSPALFQCWDGQTVWQWNLNGNNTWDIVGSRGGSPSWTSPSFVLNSTTQWSIIPATGTAGDPAGSLDMNFDCAITAVAGAKTGNRQPFTVTFPNVNNGQNGSGTIGITIDILMPSM